MKALLEALEDGVTKTFCFASKENAKRFRSFTNTYMDESGAGNGYGAYWVYRDAEVIGCDKIPRSAVTEIKPELVRSMLHDILVARTSQRNPDAAVSLTVGTKEGAIAFSFGDLPLRQRPRVGDMFRTMKSLANEAEYNVGEGRVVADNGETLDVISSWDEGDDGKPKSDAKIVKVRVGSIMKINDWKREHRENRSS